MFKKGLIPMKLSRRDFLRYSIRGTTGLIILGGAPRLVEAAYQITDPPKKGKALLYDPLLCTGINCRACERACRSWNKLPPDPATGQPESEPLKLSIMSRTVITSSKVETDGKTGEFFFKLQCRHCAEAACVEACPTKALKHNELGMVILDKELCIGCGYCAAFCPFKVPQLGGNMVTGMEKIDKCTFCTDKGLNRIADNLEPACSNICPIRPIKAIRYGDRAELVTSAKKRVKELVANGYPDAHLYGETEFGGLGLLSILLKPATFHHLPEDPKLPLALTGHQIAKQVGLWAGGLTIAGLAVNYITARTKINSANRKEE